MPRGRPKILKRCLACNEQRGRREFGDAVSDVCIACRRDKRVTEGTSVAFASCRLNTDNVDHLGAAEIEAALKVPIAIREPIMASLKLDATKHVLGSMVGQAVRCECCWETRHVRIDGYGGIATLCLRCEHQVLATGCCHLHHSRTFYPELFQPTAADTPLEIEALFFMPPPKRKEGDVLVEIDI